PQMLAMVHSGQALVQAHDGDFGAARESLRQAVAHARGAFDAPVVAACVEDAAEAALLEGDGGRAATLLAAAAPLRGGPAHTRPWTARVAERARAVLGDTAYAAATERGHAATLETVLEFLA